MVSSESSKAPHAVVHHGDGLYLAALTLASSFALCVVLWAKPNSWLFDGEWLRHGYCLRGVDVPFWNSLDLAFYVDVTLGISLGLLWIQWRKEPGMEVCSRKVPGYVLSIIGHGFGHLLESRAYFRSGGLDVSPKAWFSHSSPSGVMLFAATFWFPFMIAALSNVHNHLQRFVIALSVSAVELYCIDSRFSFTYIQTVLAMCACANQLLEPNKDRWEYAVLAKVSLLPVVVMGWTESLYCHAFYQRLGGHALYDATIALSLICFYTLCHLHYREEARKRKEL